MKIQPKLLAFLTAAALSAGCASGGGNKDGDLGDVVACFGTNFLICPGASATPPSETPSSPDSLRPPPVPFTTWSDLGYSSVTQAAALGMSVERYETASDGSVRSVFNAGTISEFPFTVPWYVNARPGTSEAFFGNGLAGNLAGGGQPGIDIAVVDVRTVPGSVSPFANSASRIALVANPYVLGWNYQSFGVWNTQFSSATGGINSTSYGAVSPSSAVPTSGQATFNGKLAGFYVSPIGDGSMATANLSVGANFSNRSLTFASTGTAITRNPDTATAAPNLNLSGTLIYSPAANKFTGTVANAGGTMSGSTNGRFYGPAAQELGGVFTVKSPTTVETFIGAYGAKR